MPWKIVKNEPRCLARSKSKPWGVVKSDDNALEGCHATEASARKQQAALYASENKLVTFIRRIHG